MSYTGSVVDRRKQGRGASYEAEEEVSCAMGLVNESVDQFDGVVVAPCKRDDDVSCAHDGAHEAMSRGS